MAINATPLWMEGLATHASQQYRRLLEGLCSFKDGVFQSGDFAVTTNNNMTVTVASGMAIIQGTEDGFQGVYFVHADENTIVSVDAAHATLPRYDMVVIRVRDDFYATGPVEGVDLFVVNGTPASSPAEPTIPDNCFVLARLTVSAADTSIASGDIVDRRSTTSGQTGRFGLKGAFRPCTSATRPTLNLQAYGDFIIETDTGRLLWYDGSAWRPLASGYQAYDASQEATTSYVATDASITLPPGNWFIQAKCEFANLAGGASNAFIQIWDSSASVALEETECFLADAVAFRYHMISMVPLTNTTTKTIQLRVKENNGGANYQFAKIRLWAVAVTSIL